MNYLETILQHKHIVFGYEHYNPLGIVRSLGEYGIKSIAIIIESKQKIVSKSKYIEQVYYVPSISEGYKVLLKNFGKLNHKPFIYTSDDKITCFLDNKYEELKDHFYLFNGGENGRIRRYMDKFEICQLAEKCGFAVADTLVADRGDIPANLTYPIITKAIISTIDNWKDDVFICQNEHDLVNAYKHIRSDKVLLQKYISKKNELCLDGYCVRRGKDTVVTIASTYNYILPDTYSPYMTVTNLDNTELKFKIEKMFAEIGFEGIFSMEFLIGEDNRLYFLEINFRNSTWSYASTCAGMPLPIMWAIDTKQGKMTDSNIKIVSAPFKAMVETTDFLVRVKTKKVSLFKWLKEVRDCKCTFYYVKSDKRPFYSVIFGKFINKFKNV